MACRFSELVIDSRDPGALAAFWAAVLDYRVLGDEHGAIEIGPVEGFGGPVAGAGGFPTGTRAAAPLGWGRQLVVDRAPELVSAQPQIVYVDAPDVSGWGPMGEIQPR